MLAKVDNGAPLLPPGFPQFFKRVNIHTLKNIQYIFGNLLAVRERYAVLPTAIANVPLRAASIYQAHLEGAPWRVALDTFAFAALFIPNGYRYAIVADMISEIVNQYFQTKSKDSDGLDCTIRENALKVLGLSESDAEENLEEVYSKVKQRLEKGRDNTVSSPIVSQKFTTLLEQVEVAYKTLSKK